MNSQLEFSALFQSNSGIVHKVCHMYCDNEEDKKDLFQDIAAKAWSAYPQFRGESKFSTWLYNIAFYGACERIRSAKKRLKQIASSNVFYELTAESHPVNIENRIQYKNYIGLLDEKELRFVLMYVEGYSYDEMEEQLGVNQNNLRVRMNRIRQKLKHL